MSQAKLSVGSASRALSSIQIRAFNTKADLLAVILKDNELARVVSENKVYIGDGQTYGGIDFSSSSDVSRIHVKYSNDPSGIPFETYGSYIGIYTGLSIDPPLDPEAYIWSKIIGEQGTPGIDGQTVHIKYSDDGISFTQPNGETIGDWIGIYSDTTLEDSNIFNDYTWKKIKGDQGLDGVAGISNYLHIKFSNSPTGDPFTEDNGEQPGEYIGLCTTEDPNDPNDYTAYIWRPMGLQGIQGVPGTSAYVHFKYSNDGGLTFTSNDGEDEGSYIGVYSDNIEVDSSNVASYVWTKIQGKDGKDGESGVSAVSAHLSNESHTIPTDENGLNGIYIGSGTEIRLYEGTAELIYDILGTSDGTWNVIATGNGITAGEVSSFSASAIISDASAMTEDVASITYLLTGKRITGEEFSLEKIQTFSKVRQGAQGITYKVEVESLNGNIFRLGQSITTTLIAHVFKNGVEVTNDIDASRFKWRRTSYISNPSGDEAWNALYAQGYKQISITIDSIDTVATFHCDIMDQ